MIRPAAARDAAEVAKIWNKVIRDSAITFNSVEKTESELVRLFITKAEQGHGFFVAEEEGAVLGFATYGQFRGGAGYARTMEHTVILGDKARGRGLGRELMGVVEDHARDGGAHSIFAGVSAENEDGISFHAAMGYNEVARLSEVGWKFDRWIDLVLMQKLL